MSVHTDIDPCKESSQKCGKVMTHLVEGKTNNTQGHIMRERKKKQNRHRHITTIIMHQVSVTVEIPLVCTYNGK